MSTWPTREDVGAYVVAVERSGEEAPLDGDALSAQVARQRAAEGLPADEGAVRDAIANSQRLGYPLPGLFYTVDEEDDLFAVDDSLPQQAEALFEHSPESLGEVSWCWKQGVRAVRVAVTRDREHYRKVLVGRLGSERVVVASARFSWRELGALVERVSDDIEDLEGTGIDVAGVADARDSVEVAFFAVDRERAEALLHDRYGPAVEPIWVGPERMVERGQAFASWVTEGDQLTVFYPLDFNGSMPGRCRAEERPDRVIVHLTIHVPLGFTTDVGGFQPAHATVGLSAPLGGRIVIDGTSGEARPEWRGGSTEPWSH